jgi:hypothetical protein
MQQQFRPPPGFMNAEGPAEGPEQCMSPEEMLGRLRSLAGHWHELARFLPALQRAGYDSVAVEEATGLERRVQNVWNTAAQVYESVKGVLPPDQLAHFDVEGEVLLYELRFLSVRQRAPAAAYIVENNLRWAGGGGWGGLPQHCALWLPPALLQAGRPAMPAASWPQVLPSARSRHRSRHPPRPPAPPAAPPRRRCWHGRPRSTSGGQATRRASATRPETCWRTSTGGM